MSGPPYAPQTASLGGLPTVDTDVPILAVFTALFLASAVTNIVLLRRNLSHGHKFLISMVFTGFSMARVLACALRISWATLPHDVPLAIAAMLLTNLGTFALYIANLLLAQRLLRARRPHLGWPRALDRVLLAAYLSIALSAILLIVFTVSSFYTLDQSFLLAARDVQLAVQTWLMVIVLAPYALLALAYLTRESAAKPQERFGKGTLHLRSLVVLALTTLMALDAGFKLGTAWTLTRYPIDHPPWYDSKACFYGFGFVVEVVYLLLVVAARVDQRFHVPDGSGKRRTYLVEAAETKGVESETEMSRENSLGQSV